MRSTLQSQYLSQAFSRLNRGVCLCCWLVGLSLVAQLLVWCTASFMDVRHKVLEDTTPGQLIVSGTEADHSKETPAGVPVAVHPAAEPAAAKPVEANRVRTSADRMMEVVQSAALSTGMLASILVLPLLALGVLLGCGSSTQGVDQTVGSFMWSLLVTLLVLPVGQIVGLPWHEGALSSYAYMTREVDQIMSESASWGSVSFYCRFALLPLACVVGTAMVGLRFGAGVSAGLVAKEDMRLDPVLEKEAANMKATSLHAGRAGAALKAASVAMAEKKPMPAINQVTAGEAPKRLI